MGEYDYLEGETVTFFIGDLDFPSVAAASVVTPLDMAGTDDTADTTVVNIIRLLQTLDEDGDPGNGISINDLATGAATQVSFEVSESEFESSVAALVANSGSSNVELISRDRAIANFENTLAAEGIDFVANSSINGAWISTLTENDLLSFVFYDDGTYVHLEVDNDDPDEISGMERGSYSIDPETNQITPVISFDGNGGTGLTDSVNGEVQLFEVSGDTLTVRFDDDQNGTIEDDEFVEFSRVIPDGLIGAWTTELSENDFLGFVFYDDGNYVHMEIDEDDPSEISGMEWGTYSIDAETGRITPAIVFDNNGGTGLNDYENGGLLFAQVSGDSLTLEFDGNGNGVIDATGESLAFSRR